MIMNLFFVILFCSAFNTAIFLLAQKWGFIEALQLKFKTELVRCEFCMFFWAAIIELSILYAINCHFDVFGCLMIIPFSLCAAVFSRYFLRSNH